MRSSSRPDDADGEGRRDHAGPDRQAAAVQQVHRVGPEQDELAMGEVEDAHHAGDDAEPEHDQHEDRAVCENVEKEWNYRHAVLPAFPQTMPRFAQCVKRRAIERIAVERTFSDAGNGVEFACRRLGRRRTAFGTDSPANCPHIPAQRRQSPVTSHPMQMEFACSPPRSKLPATCRTSSGRRSMDR